MYSAIPNPSGEIFGLPIYGLKLLKFVELAEKLVKKKQKVLFTTLGLPSIVITQKSEDLFNHFHHADVVLPDGIFPLIAAKLRSINIPERVSGPDFVDCFLPIIEKQAFTVFFMGSTHTILKRIVYNLRKKHPKLIISGTLSPPFKEFDAKINQSIINKINKVKPDILFVGMTAPKQELWLSKHFEKLDVSFAMGIGAAFDYMAGTKRKTPKAIGRLGFEWLFRLVHEPKRLLRRNLDSALFIGLLFKNYLKKSSYQNKHNIC